MAALARITWSLSHIISSLRTNFQLINRHERWRVTYLGALTSEYKRRLHLSRVFRSGDYEWQDPKSEDEVVNVVFIDKNGKRHPIRGKIGDNLMYLAHRYDIEMEGACEASLACTTCHVYVLGDHLTRLPEASEKEEDLLDLAPFLREDSRLGCQIILSKDLEGLEVQLPAATRNFYVDGHKPKPH